MKTMNAPSPSPSSFLDQPPHKNLEPVDLIAFDLQVSIKPEGAEVFITPLIVRNTRMDDVGVGYSMEIANKSGKTWSHARLSRRQFGIDTFSLDMKLSQGLHREGGDLEKKTAPRIKDRSWLEASARVWCWKKDQALAIQALKDAFAHSIAGLINTAEILDAQVKGKVYEPATLNPEVLAYKARKATVRP